jgi:23S rRNA (uracil1939-C5)-methyltransferase
MSRKNNIPQVYEALAVIDIASEGMGIAKKEGMVIFVEGAVTGDIVDVQITRKKSGFRQGKVINFIKKSEIRIAPSCQHFGVCGGCKWQNLPYDFQLTHKFKQVADALKRIAKVELPEIQPIIGAPEFFHYRNKMEYTFSASRWLTNEEISENLQIDQRNALGFHVPVRFDKVLAIDKCYLQAEPGNAIRDYVYKYALENKLGFFHLVEQTGLLRNLILRNNQENEWMLILSVTEENDALFALLNAVSEKFPQITSLQYAVNTKRNDTLQDIEVKLFKGNPTLTEKMEDLSFSIRPKSFYQTNPQQAYNLYCVAREMAQIRSSDVVYDLYTGTGTIALFISRMAKKVIGIEYVEDAIADARQNAQDNLIENVDFFAADMKDLLKPSFFIEHGKPDVIITDPPRAGMHEDVVKCLMESNARKIVYVSCNAATQARDIAMLDAKYKVTAVQPVDMFPQTTHVENVVCLEIRV